MRYIKGLLLTYWVVHRTIRRGFLTGVADNQTAEASRGEMGRSWETP